MLPESIKHMVIHFTRLLKLKNEPGFYVEQKKKKILLTNEIKQKHQSFISTVLAHSGIHISDPANELTSVGGDDILL